MYILNLIIKVVIITTILGYSDELSVLASTLIFSNYIASSKTDVEILSKKSITSNVNKFWSDSIFKSNKSKLAIQLRVRFEDKTQASYSQIFVIKFEDKQWLIDRLLNINQFKGDEYESKNPVEIIFFYSIIPKELNSNYDLNYGNEIKNPSLVPQRINNFALANNTLPLTTDLTEWGKILDQFKNRFNIKKLNSPFTYMVFKYTDNLSYNLVKVKDKAKSTILEFKEYLGITNTTFTRVIGSTKYCIENSKLVFKEVSKKFQYMEKTSTHEKPFTKFITLDIETRSIDGVLTPYCISLYDGIKSWSFYATDFSESDEMLRVAIKSLLRNKYNHYVVYAH